MQGVGISASFGGTGLDYAKLATMFLKLDQSTPQTVIGIPYFFNGLKIGGELHFGGGSDFFIVNDNLSNIAGTIAENTNIFNYLYQIQSDSFYATGSNGSVYGFETNLPVFFGTSTTTSYINDTATFMSVDIDNRILYASNGSTPNLDWNTPNLLTLGADIDGVSTYDILNMVSGTFGTLYGSTAANGDISIYGTSHATKTSSYVLLQQTGGNVGIGTTTPSGAIFCMDYAAGGAVNWAEFKTGNTVRMVLRYYGTTPFEEFDFYIPASNAGMNFKTGSGGIRIVPWTIGGQDVLYFQGINQDFAFSSGGGVAGRLLTFNFVTSAVNGKLYVGSLTPPVTSANLNVLTSMSIANGSCGMYFFNFGSTNYLQLGTTFSGGGEVSALKCTGTQGYPNLFWVEQNQFTHYTDMYFSGSGAGLPYGSCWGNEIAWSQASAAQNTWYLISDTDMTDGQLNLVTHDGSGKLTVSIAGRYLCNYTGSFEASTGANVHLQTSFAVNGTATNDGMNHFETFGANVQSATSGTAILNLAANATVQVAIRTTDAGTPTLSCDHLNLTIVQIGG